MGAAYDRVTAALAEITGYHAIGNGNWRCPAHPDNRPSLKVSNGGDRVLLNCHAGCDTLDILHALNLTYVDLYDEPAKASKPTKRIVDAYHYEDETGTLLYQVVRYDPKGFGQRRPHNGDWTWNMNGVRRVLYRLPELINAIKLGVPVFVVEGEKDADALTAHGFPATTSPGGAGKWRPEYTDTFKGADVVIIADNDKPGHNHARHVADQLQHVAATVIIQLPAPGFKDIAEQLGATGTIGGLQDLDVNEEPTGDSLLFHDWTPAELLDADTGFTWLVEGMYAQPTYGMTAGESKTAKTTIGVITQMSIASGLPVLGRFRVTRPRPVVIYVGEGGRIPHTRLLSRVAEAMGIEWRDLPIYPRYEIAAINSTRFQATLHRDLEKYEPGLVIIDPYYAFHGSKADSKNLHEEAEVLNGASSVCVEAGAVLDITNHFNRNEGKGLRRITMAGGAEWVDTWRLVEHRNPPDIDTGHLELRLEIGSRQWGGSTWDVDLNLGRFQPELGIYDGPISWEIRRPGKTNDTRVDKIIEAIKNAPYAYQKEELAKLAGGQLKGARELVEHLETTKQICAQLVDKPDSRGRNRKIWTYALTQRPTPDDTSEETF